MAAAILSPHLDDAVLSCWHVLAQPGDVNVINIFTGAPANVVAPAWWDQLTGATDSGQRMRERVGEDREALAFAGRTPVNLGFLDEQYREVEQPLAPLTSEIAGLLVPGVRVYAPAAFGGHADHVLVRAAALVLRGAGFAVSLFADLPHAIVHGWPQWVTGVEVVVELVVADRALVGAQDPALEQRRDDMHVRQRDGRRIAAARHVVTTCVKR